MPARHPFQRILRDAPRLWRGSPSHTIDATNIIEETTTLTGTPAGKNDNSIVRSNDWRVAGSGHWALEQVALSPAWTTPVGGAELLDGTTRRQRRRTGRSQEGLLDRLPRWRDEQRERETQQALTELTHQAAQLAEHMALIVQPGMRVRWATDITTESAGKRAGSLPRNGPREANAPQVGDLVLDPELLRPRPGWDTAHRLDALMGRVLHDAAHSRHTPADFRADLARAALRSGLFASTTLPDEEVPILPPALLILFLLIEDVALNSWLCATFPGFRGYLDAACLWTIPAIDVRRRQRDLEKAISPAGLLAVLSAVLSHRMSSEAIPASAREIVVTLAELARQIEPDAPPADRYALALTLYSMLRDFLRSTTTQPDQNGQPDPDKGSQRGEDDDPLVRRAQPSLANETLDRADQRALQDLLNLIAQDRLDPQAALAQAAQRERALPEQRADMEEPGSAAVRRATQRDDSGGSDETEILTYGKIAMPSQTVVTLLTPAITQSARSRYRQAHYATRPQIAALRQALRFKLAERRHLLHARSSGLIDEQALYRLPGGDERVFMHRGIESAPDQDLCILLDESASMGAKQRHVREVAVLFHHTLADLPGVRHWVFGFSAFGSQCTIYRYISPQRPDLQQAERLGAISARQGTPLAEAVAGAAEQMLREGQGQHRLMIVVTDGEPDDQRSARDALREIAAHGISVLGIGVADSAVPLASLFPHFILSTDLPGLPRKVAGILKATIGVEGPGG